MSTSSKMAEEWVREIWANEVKDEQKNKAPFGQIISVKDAYLAGFAACVEEARQIGEHDPEDAAPWWLEKLEALLAEDK